MARHGTARRGTARRGTARQGNYESHGRSTVAQIFHGWAGRGPARHGPARHGGARQGNYESHGRLTVAQIYAARPCEARRGEAGRGRAWLGKAGQLREPRAVNSGTNLRGFQLSRGRLPEVLDNPRRICEHNLHHLARGGVILTAPHPFTSRLAVGEWPELVGLKLVQVVRPHV